MTDVTCPSCGAEIPDSPLQVCQSCARTLVVEGGVGRLATGEDMAWLSPDTLSDLRRSRPAAWREKQMATKARLRAAKEQA